MADPINDNNDNASAEPSVAEEQATPAREPTAAEAVSGYVNTVIEQGANAELIRIATLKEIQAQQQQTINTPGTTPQRIVRATPADPFSPQPQRCLWSPNRR